MMVGPDIFLLQVCVCKITEFMSIYWDLPFVLLASERFDLFGFFGKCGFRCQYG